MIFFSSKKFMKICSKTHSLKKFPGEVCPRTPLAYAWQRHASQGASRHAARPAPKSCPPPLANHTYSHGLQPRNLLEEIRSQNPRWQTVYCV